MKNVNGLKMYIKPELNIEHFELSESVAASCRFKLASADFSCYKFGGFKNLFGDDNDVEGNAYCYHSSSDLMTVVNES